MVGIDIVSITRIRRILHSVGGESFVDRVLTLKEQERFRSSDPKEMPELLARFYAAKEAVIKASSDRLSLSDLGAINVMADGNGQLIAETRNGRNRFFVSTDRHGDTMLAVATVDECRN